MEKEGSFSMALEFDNSDRSESAKVKVPASVAAHLKKGWLEFGYAC